MTEPRHLADDELLLLGDARNNFGRTGPGQAAGAHLATCAPCRVRLARLTVLDAALRTAHADDDPAGETRRRHRRARLQQRMAETTTAAPWSGARLWASLAGGALAALAIGALGLAGVRVGNFPLRTPERATFGVAHTRALPISSITPGATVAVPAEVLCSQLPLAPSPIPDAVRADVLRAYGMEQLGDQEYELDYLITPDLGGAPDPRNLWPEPYHSPIWNARVKDELESLLPRLVCEGKVDLQTAQRDIAVDWVAAYKKYFKTDRPLRES